MSLLALILAAFFAMNMGGSGMSPAFAAPIVYRNSYVGKNEQGDRRQ